MQWTWVLTGESTKASPTWASPTKGCPSKQEEPCSSHQDTQQRWKALECQRWEWGKQKKSTSKLCPAMLGEAAAGHATRQRQPQLRTVSPGGQDVSFPKGHLQSQTKTQRGRWAGQPLQSSQVGEGRVGQRELRRQSSKCLLQNTVQARQMFPNVLWYIHWMKHCKYLAGAHVNLGTSIMIWISLEVQTKPVAGSGMETDSHCNRRAPACWRMTSFSPEVEIHIQGWQPTESWDPNSYRGRMERKLRTTHRSPATTSYSWVLALQLHWTSMWLMELHSILSMAPLPLWDLMVDSAFGTKMPEQN